MADDLPGMSFWDILGVINERYPEIIPFLQKPGVWDVYAAAAQNPNMSAEEVTQKFQQTEYYKSTPQAQRQWDILLVTDPATAQQDGQRAAQMIGDLSTQLGLQLTDDQKWNYSVAATMGQWDATRAKYELLSAGGPTGDMQSGVLGDTAAQVHKLGEAYGQPMSDASVMEWSRKIASGASSMEALQGGLQGWAKNLYPALATSIDQGMTVRDYASPYLQLAGTELGINPAEIKLTDPKWTNLFLTQDKAGTQVTRSLQDAQSTIRTDPSYGFDHSSQATQTASQLATQLSQRFGATG